MKLLKFTLMNLMVGAMSLSAISQTHMLNPSNTPYAHMGESVAQFGGYSLFGAYEDGILLDQYGNKTLPGAVYLFNSNGVLERSYMLTADSLRYANVGRSVTLNSNFIAATVTGTIITQGPRPCVYIAGKTNGVWNNNYSYSITDPDVVINTELQVALDGYGTLAIGSPLSTVNGVQTGAVFIYEFVSNQWVKKQVLVPSNAIANSRFGKSIAFHNNYLIVGAPQSEGGRVYTFSKNGTWSQLNVFPSGTTYAGARLGERVDVSDNTAVVSAPNHNGTGSVFFLDLQNNQWVVSSQISNLKATSVAIENVKAVVGVDNGQYSVNGIAAQFYLKDWNGWVLKKTRTSTEAGDNFAFDVDIEGSKVLVSRKYADKNGIVNVGAGVSYDYWSTIYSSSREAGDFEEAVEVNNLYPNPTTLSEITFNSTEEIVEVDAYSQNGSSSKLSFSGNKIDVRSLAPGLYTLQIRTANGVESRKLSVL
ncbi:T9SS type A sorting domain-containing protein [Sporocytophaga myxococcoides]|uniref:T9SS type A sorting domain-containing protein n=1 Tax=Sporocytophaga myxococcoides TaxID=153721 RepID=UPI00048B3E38|nr:T9SS type A sorting domain-containing protein [Sporocytophaga myxococcoides]